MCNKAFMAKEGIRNNVLVMHIQKEGSVRSNPQVIHEDKQSVIKEWSKNTCLRSFWALYKTDYKKTAIKKQQMRSSTKKLK